MERRTLLALALSFLIILFYPHVLRIFYPDYGKPLPDRQAGAAPVVAKTAAPDAAAPEAPHALLKTGGAPEMKSPLRFGAYELVLSESAGSIVEVRFTDHKDPVDGKPLEFLETPDGAWGVGATAVSVNGKDAPAEFKTQKSGLEVTSESDGPGYRLVKEFNFDKSLYGHGLSIKYSNTSGQSQNVRLHILAGSGLVAKNTIDKQYFEANWIEADRVEHVKPLGTGKIKNSPRPVIGVSIKDRHFSSILKAHESAAPAAAQGLENGRFAPFSIVDFELAAGASWTGEYLLYIGPNRADALKPFGLESVIHFGKLDGICKVLLGSLELLHGVVRNYGVAIILLTLAINLLLFPLTRASLLSMKRMQLVQPQMTKIREKFSKDPARMNKEMMELYRKYKVNPMGGCLPMILQMPVFISLYVALSKSVDLLGARFLWVDDLSYPDVVPLPFELPLIGKTLHILPLIMVGAMVAQQKISQSRTPVSADPNMAQQQKIMTVMMPIVFGFLFYAMPSGLVIYWLTNTVVMTSAQLLLFKQDIEP